MKIKMFFFATVLFLLACNKGPIVSPNYSALDQTDRFSLFGQMQVYNNDRIYLLDYKKYTGRDAQELLTQAGRVYTIYIYNDVLTNGSKFIPVVNKLLPVASNAIWEEKELRFMNGLLPGQFHSEAELMDATFGSHPGVKIRSTGNAYQLNLAVEVLTTPTLAGDVPDAKRTVK